MKKWLQSDIADKIKPKTLEGPAGKRMPNKLVSACTFVNVL